MYISDRDSMFQIEISLSVIQISLLKLKISLFMYSGISY